MFNVKNKNIEDAHLKSLINKLKSFYDLVQ